MALLKQVILVTDYYYWYIRTDGVVERIHQSTGKSYIMVNRLSPLYNELFVKIKGKSYQVKKLVAAAFIPKYGDGSKWNVLFHDNDPTNCRYSNIYLVDRSNHSKVTGAKSRSIPVVARIDGERKEYLSVRSAAKDLHVSYQTLFDYLNGRFKKSVLDGVNVRYLI